jgi:Restriction endonuclease
MARPTKTTNRIHFTDLQDRRFEDLAMQIVYKLHKWEDINHDGRSGDDDGVDIRAVERLDDGSLRYWFVQCKRYKTIAWAGLKKAVDEALKKSKSIPDVLLVVVGCDVSQKARESYVNYANGKGVANAYIWTASTLEAKLYSDCPDLLFAFFGISIAKRERSRESSVKRNLTMKRRLKRIFNDRNLPYPVIIRSIDDEKYPTVDADPPLGRMSSWVRLGLYGFYHGGIEVSSGVSGFAYVIISREAQPWHSPWAIVDTHKEGIPYVGEDQEDENCFSGYRFYDYIDKNSYIVCKARWMWRIPYKNIIECDDDGDEDYSEPHLFCHFVYEGEPYEEKICKTVGASGELWDGIMLEPSLQFSFKDC